MARITQIQVRRDTASNWSTLNPRLEAGEIGFESDTGKFKIGPTGGALWNSITKYAVDASYVTGNTLSTSVTSATGLTSIGTLGSLSVTGTVSAGTFSGNGAAITSLNAGNISGVVGTSNGGTGATTAALALQALGAPSLTTGNTFSTGTQIIQAGANNIVPLRLKRNSASQTADFLQANTSDDVTTLAKIDKDGKITAADFIDSSMATAGVVTNQAGGLFVSATTLPVTLGGTGLAYSDRTPVARLIQTTTLNGSTTANTYTNAFATNISGGSGTPAYVSFPVTGFYYFECVLRCTRGVSAASNSLITQAIYKDSSNTDKSFVYALLRGEYINTSNAAASVISSSSNTTLATSTLAGTANTNTIVRYSGVIYGAANDRLSFGFAANQNTTTAPTCVFGYLAVYQLLDTAGGNSFSGNVVT